MSVFKRSDYNMLVFSFLKDPRNISYPKEYAIAKKLLSEYGDFTFWKSTLLQEKHKVLNSLAYFLTEEGKEFLKINYYTHEKRGELKVVSYEKTESPLNKKKVGEDLALKKKSKKKSILDFIKDDT